MSKALPTEIEQFLAFQAELLAQGIKGLPLEEILRLWPTIQAIRERLDDVKNGRVPPQAAFDEEFCRKHAAALAWPPNSHQ
jgi:hypothetical protein